MNAASMSKLTGGLLVWSRSGVPAGQAQTACTDLLMSTPLHRSRIGPRPASGNPETPPGGGRAGPVARPTPPPCAYQRKACAGVRARGVTAGKSKQRRLLRKPSSVDVSVGGQDEPRGSANFVVIVRIITGPGTGRSHDPVTPELTPIGARLAAGGGGSTRSGSAARKSDGS